MATQTAGQTLKRFYRDVSPQVTLAEGAGPDPEIADVQDRRDARCPDRLDAAGGPARVAVPIPANTTMGNDHSRWVLPLPGDFC